MDTEQAQRILYDIQGGIAPATSSLKYTPEMLTFRTTVEAEWEEWQKDHPDAILDVPAEMSSDPLPKGALAGVTAKESGGHFYGAWKGGSKSAGGGSMPTLTDEKGALAFLGPIAAMKNGVLHINGKPATAAQIKSVNTYLATSASWAKDKVTMAAGGDAFTKGLPKQMFAKEGAVVYTLTEADRIALAAIAEKGGDHFYGAWKGGSAKSGGGPSGGADGNPLTSSYEEQMLSPGFGYTAPYGTPEFKQQAIARLGAADAADKAAGTGRWAGQPMHGVVQTMPPLPPELQSFAAKYGTPAFKEEAIARLGAAAAADAAMHGVVQTLPPMFPALHGVTQKPGKQSEAARLMAISRGPGITFVSATREGGMYRLTEADRLALHAVGQPVPVMERDFSGKKRAAMADAGSAMPDGSFPIATAEDLANAVQAIGRAKDPEAAKAHIIKRAKALGLTASLPDTWTVKEGYAKPKAKKPATPVRESVAFGDVEVRALLLTGDGEDTTLREAVVMLDRAPTTAKVLAYGEDTLVFPDYTGGFDMLTAPYTKPEPYKPMGDEDASWDVADAAEVLRKLARMKKDESDDADQQAMLQTAIGAVADFLKSEADEIGTETEMCADCNDPMNCDCTTCPCSAPGHGIAESQAVAEVIAESVGEGPLATAIREAGRRNSAKDSDTLRQIVKLVKSLGIDIPVDEDTEAPTTVSTVESIDDSATAEDVTFREAGAYGDYVTLAEAAPQFDEATRTVWVTPIKPGWGNARDNNYYPTDTLREATTSGRFNHLKMYRDHPRKSDEKDLPERSVKDWFATTREAVWDDSRQRPRVPIKVHSEEDFRKWQEAPEQVALSILGGGMARPGQAEGRSGRILESISKVRSVDWVTEAGAGGGIDFAESASSSSEETNVEMDIEDLTPEQLAEANPALYEHLVGMGKALAGGDQEAAAADRAARKAAKDAEGEAAGKAGEATTKESDIPAWFAPFAPVLTSIATREAAAATDVDKAEAKKVVDAAIGATTLPASAKAVVARHFAEATIGEGRAYADETVLKEAIAAEVKDAEELLGIKTAGKSSVVGLGEGATHVAEGAVGIREAVKGDIESRWGKEAFPAKDQLVFTAEQVSNPGGSRPTLVVAENSGSDDAPATALSESGQSVQASLAARF